MDFGPPPKAGPGASAHGEPRGAWNGRTERGAAGIAGAGDLGRGRLEVRPGVRSLLTASVRPPLTRAACAGTTIDALPPDCLALIADRLVSTNPLWDRHDVLQQACNLTKVGHSPASRILAESLFQSLSPRMGGWAAVQAAFALLLWFIYF